MKKIKHWINSRICKNWATIACTRVTLETNSNLKYLRNSDQALKTRKDIPLALDLR